MKSFQNPYLNPTMNPFKRLSWKELEKHYSGKTFTRHRRTLKVIDVTLGGDVIVRQRGKARAFMHQSLFMQWLKA